MAITRTKGSNACWLPSKDDDLRLEKGLDAWDSCYILTFLDDRAQQAFKKATYRMLIFNSPSVMSLPERMTPRIKEAPLAVESHLFVPL